MDTVTWGRETVMQNCSGQIVHACFHTDLPPWTLLALALTAANIDIHAGIRIIRENFCEEDFEVFESICCIFQVLKCVCWSNTACDSWLQMTLAACAGWAQRVGRCFVPLGIACLPWWLAHRYWGRTGSPWHTLFTLCPFQSPWHYQPTHVWVDFI